MRMAVAHTAVADTAVVAMAPLEAAMAAEVMAPAAAEKAEAAAEKAQAVEETEQAVEETEQAAAVKAMQGVRGPQFSDRWSSGCPPGTQSTACRPP